MIHYHGSSIGGYSDEHHRFYDNRHVFVSFARTEDMGIVAAHASSFAFDNGAYTAWRKGKKYDWRRYAQWCKDWCRHPGFDWCVIPDVIDGDEKQNDLMISRFVNWDGWRGERWHCRMAPVFHLHESLERLDRLVKGWDIVCLGSSGDYATPGTESWWYRISEIMRVACDDSGRPRTKLHGLRMLDARILERLPLHSADSTRAARRSVDTWMYGTYVPPTRAQRITVLADRIEQWKSAPRYIWQPIQQDLFTLG